LLAVALALATGALVATGPSSSARLAWYGTAASVALLLIGLVSASTPVAISSLPVLGALLLLRADNRLELAPIYGWCLLTVGELANRAIELRGPGLIAPQVIRSRLLACVAPGAIGACAATAVALAVTVAPARSAGLTVAGAIALVAACVAIVALARRRMRGLTPSRAAARSHR
jgi:hypothetical protein